MNHNLYFMKAPVLAAMLFFLSGKLCAQVDSVYYHDGIYESQIGFNATTDAARLAVRFTPPVYPLRLAGIRAYFRNCHPISNFKWVVYTDSAGSATGPANANEVYIDTVHTSNPAAGGTPNVVYDSYIDLTSQNIIINSGDVYAGVVQGLQFIGLARDTIPVDTTYNNRQWIYLNFTWNTMASSSFGGRLGLTAFFDTPPPSGITENKVSSSLSMSVSPNPVKDHAFIQYDLPYESNVSIDIVNMLGQNVRNILNNEKVSSGKHFVAFETGFLKPGIYLCRVKAGTSSVSARIVVSE